MTVIKILEPALSAQAQLINQNHRKLPPSECPKTNPLDSSPFLVVPLHYFLFVQWDFTLFSDRSENRISR